MHSATLYNNQEGNRQKHQNQAQNQEDLQCLRGAVLQYPSFPAPPWLLGGAGHGGGLGGEKAAQ